MKEKLKRLFYQYFDYKIVGSYYDTTHDKHGREVLKRKYIKKYYWKGKKKHGK